MNPAMLAASHRYTHSLHKEGLGIVLRHKFPKAWKVKSNSVVARLAALPKNLWFALGAGFSSGARCIQALQLPFTSGCAFSKTFRQLFTALFLGFANLPSKETSRPRGLSFERSSLFASSEGGQANGIRLSAALLKRIFPSPLSVCAFGPAPPVG